MAEILLDQRAPREMPLTGWVGQRVLIEHVFYNADGSENRLKLAEGEIKGEPGCFREADICTVACNRLHFYRVESAANANLRIVIPVPERITSEAYSRMEISPVELAPEEKQQ